MNKKLLLLALPAFMVLSSCGAHSVEQPEERLEAAMSESTVAQEEDARELVRTNTIYRVALTSDYVKVGYQIQFNANDEGDADDTISIRFVAALKGEVTSAFWHRGLAQPNGYEGADVGGGSWKYKFNDKTTHQSTKFYTALNNDGVRVAAGEGDFVGYSSFAIYTLMNIPYETYKDSYLAAYVELTSDNTIKSQGIAVKIEKDGTASKNRFYFDASKTGHFLQGTINNQVRDGKTNPVLYEDEETVSGENFASYSSVPLKTTDSFGSFYYAVGTTFQYFGHSGFFNESSSLITESASLSGYNAANYNGVYNLFVSSHYIEDVEDLRNHVYTRAVSYESSLVFYFDANVWDTAGANFRMYMWKNGGSASDNQTLESGDRTIINVGGEPKEVYEFSSFDFSKYDSFKIERLNSANSEVWNNTGDKVDETSYVYSTGPYLYYKVNNWDGSYGWFPYSIAPIV